MKRVSIAILFASVFVYSFAFAYTATVVSQEGKVMIRLDPDSDWMDSVPGALLFDYSEVQTFADSSCTVAFNDSMQDIVTVQENSSLIIENIRPAKVLLTLGRVFALIKDIKSTGSFEVRTPTATAGARGTGWSVSFAGDSTKVLCFEDSIHLTGNDQDGTIVEELQLREGFGVLIDENGAAGDIFKLLQADFREWEDFTQNINQVSEKREKAQGDGPGRDASAVLQEQPVMFDLREEQKSGFREDAIIREREKFDDGSSENDGYSPP